MHENTDLPKDVMTEALLIGALLQDELSAELAAALRKHEPPRNGHEIYGVVKEKLDKFFDLVKADASCLGQYERELLRVAVTALRGAAMYRRLRGEGSA